MALFQANSVFRNRVYRDTDSCLQRYGAGCDVPCNLNPSYPVDEYRTRFFGLGETNNFIVMPVRYAPHIRIRAIIMRRFGSVESNAF